jgi:membrane protein insertase Oxa1/YidC/SpoIIIJ
MLSATTIKSLNKTLSSHNFVRGWKLIQNNNTIFGTSPFCTKILFKGNMASSIAKRTASTSTEEKVANAVTQTVPSLFDYFSQFPPFPWVAESAIWLQGQSMLNYLSCLLRIFKAGIPWWILISLSAVGMKLALYPVTKISAKNALISVRSPAANVLRRMFTETSDIDEKKKLRAAIQNTLKKEGYRLWKLLLPYLTAIPISISIAVTIRVLAATEPSFAVGGVSWFENLSISDPFWRLPWIMSLTTFFNWELTRRGIEYKGLWKVWRYFVSAFYLMLTPLTGELPQVRLFHNSNNKTYTILFLSIFRDCMSFG